MNPTEVSFLSPTLGPVLSSPPVGVGSREEGGSWQGQDPQRKPWGVLCLPHSCPSLPICCQGLHYLPLLRRSPICLLSLPLSPVPACSTLGLPSPPLRGPPAFQALSGPTPPTSFPALKGKTIRVSLTSSGLPEGQTSLCVCLPWSRLRPLAPGDPPGNLLA